MARPKVASITIRMDNGREIVLENKDLKLSALFFDAHGVKKILHGFYVNEKKQKQAEDLLAAWGDDDTSTVGVMRKNPDCAYDPIP